MSTIPATSQTLAPTLRPVGVFSFSLGAAVSPAGFTPIVGANACGKSTRLRTECGDLANIPDAQGEAEVARQ